LIRVIGIGSPFGDDNVGLQVARILAEAPPPDCDVIIADRPGAGLIELLDGADAAIVIDSVCSGAPPGTIHELKFDDLRHYPAGLVSSHDLGLATAIQLARALGRAPVCGRIIGLEIAPPRSQPTGLLSSHSKASIGRLVDRVRACAAELTAESNV